MRLTDEIIDFNLISDFPFEKPFSELKTIDYYPTDEEQMSNEEKIAFFPEYTSLPLSYHYLEYWNYGRLD